MYMCVEYKCVCVPAAGVGRGVDGPKKLQPEAGLTGIRSPSSHHRRPKDLRLSTESPGLLSPLMSQDAPER